MQSFLLEWYDAAHRPLPWRETSDPYAIWVSEIMLQQTRAETVIGYYTRFLSQFPTVFDLANAQEEQVLKAWEGLGYYSRARNLKKCAQEVVANHSGLFPKDAASLKTLPGIGDYTSGAVASIAFGQQVPAVDGNVERVVSRLRGIREDVGIPSVKRHLRAEATAFVPKERPGDFNQAMMELGARVCQPVPRCTECPITQFCDAYDAGDADALPIKQRKAPQRIISRGVAIVLHGDQVLLHRREERLLQGLWCFPGTDDITDPKDIARRMAKLGLTLHYERPLGEARHVFTHIIWEMELMQFTAEASVCPPGYQWANLATLHALPLPTAMKAAKAAAEELLGK